MSHVEPKCHKSDDVNWQCPHLAESVLDVVHTVGCQKDCAAVTTACTQLMAYLYKLHLCPELSEVHNHEGYDYDTEHEHVLRRPLYACWLCCYRVAVVAARLAVLHRKPECINNVYNEAGGKNRCSDQCVPISTQELADHVVCVRRYQGYCVH